MVEKNKKLNRIYPGVGTSSFAAKLNLAGLKTEIDKIGVNKSLFTDLS